MVWVAQTPHPSTVTDGIGGAKDPSVHCYGRNRDRTTDTEDGWGVGHPSVQKSTKTSVSMVNFIVVYYATNVLNKVFISSLQFLHRHALLTHHTF